MSWKKQGPIYVPTSNGTWRVSHTQFPIVLPIPSNRFRIYYGTRSAAIQTVTSYIEVDADDPSRVLYEHDEPVLGLGALGCFDDGGALPAWIVETEGKHYLYYVGWNAGVTVSYRNSIGLAVSEDGGRSFTRMFDGPIVDRTATEPHFCSSPCVLKERDRWIMWYLNGVRWDLIDGRPEPIYLLRVTTSDDGIHWKRPGKVAIDLKSPEEGGIARPSVLVEDGVYKMWSSTRGIRDYRQNPEHAYPIGYAETGDGLSWTRMDDRAGIDVSPEGWDSQMIEFPYVLRHGGRKLLFYNGNGFGVTGTGYAVWEDA